MHGFPSAFPLSFFLPFLSFFFCLVLSVTPPSTFRSLFAGFSLSLSLSLSLALRRPPLDTRQRTHVITPRTGARDTRERRGREIDEQQLVHVRVREGARAQSAVQQQTGRQADRPAVAAESELTGVQSLSSSRCSRVPHPRFRHRHRRCADAVVAVRRSLPAVTRATIVGYQVAVIGAAALPI